MDNRSLTSFGIVSRPVEVSSISAHDTYSDESLPITPDATHASKSFYRASSFSPKRISLDASASSPAAQRRRHRIGGGVTRIAEIDQRRDGVCDRRRRQALSEPCFRPMVPEAVPA